MDVLLVRDVDKLGKRGTKVAVKPGFARNYLLPFGYAVLPSPGNERRVELSRRAWLAEEKKIVEAQQALAELLKPVTLTVVEKASDEGRLYGSVTDKVVAAALAGQGFKLDPRVVRLDAPIREVGNYNVRLHLHADVEMFMPVRVRAEGYEEWEPGMPMRKAAQSSAPSASKN